MPLSRSTLALALLCCCSREVAAGTPQDSSGARQPPAGHQLVVAQAGASRAQKPAQPVALSADMAAPYFASGAAGKAAERLALEDWKAAREGFAVLLRQRRSRLDPVHRARVRLLMAVCDARLGQWARAAAGFAHAARKLPIIADYLHYQAARAHYFDHQLGPAMDHARRVAADSIAGADAELLIGDVLRGQSDHRAMAAHYAGYLQRRPGGIRRTEARYRLAQAKDALGRATPEALELYRRVAISSPLSPWGQSSKERFEALLSTVDGAARARYQTLTADELITRGMVYYRAMRNPLSEADFAAALQAPGLTAESRCVAAYHRADSIFKARDREGAAPRFDDAIAACKQAKNIDLHVKAAYQAGRSYAFIGKHQTAIQRYRVAETVSPEHTYVDDARLRQAEEYAELGNQVQVGRVLASIPKKYPGGDMRAEAMWRLGWRAYRAGKYSQAVSWFRRQIAVMPIDHNFWAEGQAQYWMGRALARLGRPRQAVAAYRDAVVRYPLSYYALLALNRLRSEHPEAFKAVVGEIRAPAPDAAPAGPLRFAPRPEYASEGFARALEFIRLGLGPPAEAELRRLGLNIPAGKDRVADPQRVETIWATAFLYHRAGRYSQSHWPTRWHVLDYKRAWPVGENRERWLIAYPRGYWNLLAQHAGKHGFPVELLIAIVREESAFNPLLESYANAIGLTQMIFPTARRFGRGTGIAVTRDNLRDPEKNVTIGSRFLAFLWDKWQAQVMLIPPSYNAGEGAVSRWLRERGALPADEWIETIKGDQPRRYSKRVLASYFTYSYLYRDAIPEVSFAIPDGLVPRAKKRAPAGRKKSRRARD